MNCPTVLPIIFDRENDRKKMIGEIDRVKIAYHLRLAATVAATEVAINVALIGVLSSRLTRQPCDH